MSQHVVRSGSSVFGTIFGNSRDICGDYFVCLFLLVSELVLRKKKRHTIGQTHAHTTTQ